LAFTVLGADDGAAEAAGREDAGRLTLVPVTLAKGLEFDHVILVEPGRIATGEAYGLRRLYVALTRAVSRLTVFHGEPLPAELALHTIGRRALFNRPSRGRRPPPVFLSERDNGVRRVASPEVTPEPEQPAVLRRAGPVWSW
jgi:hypothetical protein